MSMKRETKGESIKFRLSVDELILLSKVCRDMGLPLSTWVRMVLRGAAREYAKSHGIEIPKDEG